MLQKKMGLISRLVLRLLVDGKRDSSVRDDTQKAGRDPAVQCLEAVLANNCP